MSVDEIMMAFSRGEMTADEANSKLIEVDSEFRLDPDRHTITPEERAESASTSNPTTANGWGLLDMGLGAMSKVRVKNGKLVDTSVGDMIAFYYIDGHMFKVNRNVLVRVD